jgi:hypothetical protein
MGVGLVVAAATLIGDHRRVEGALDELGATESMFLVVAPIESGQAIGPTDVVEVRVPRRFRIATAIDEVESHLALHDLAPGDPLTASNTTLEANTIVPDGWRALTVDAGALAERLVQGTVVDVMASGTFLVEGALVVDVIDDRSVLVAVPQDRVVAVADAASIGIAVLAISN